MNFSFIGRRPDRRQVTQIARPLGVDWQHLVAIISFAIVCAVLRSSPTGASSRCEQRREQITQGITNAEKIKAELDKTETQRQEVMAQAPTQGAKFIEEARRRPACSKRRPRRPLPPPNRSWPRHAKPPRRTTTECSPISNARSASLVV
jgi:hypothetical protein